MNERKDSRNRILIAEDDPVSRRVLQGLLAKWGYEIVSAADGAQAAKLLEAEDAPALAILDWMMPGMEGPELCRRLRERADRPYTYLLLLTAKTQKQDLSLALEAGADDYLTKPFDAQELRARLHVGQRILDLQSGLIEARETLRFQATHDPLTGMWNHGVVIDAIDRESSRQLREGGTFGIILMDLDHFKRVNDTYGHLAGDAVLREAAHRITGCVRGYDIVGRYGGEEFLVVVPSSEENNVLKLAERVREAIGSVPIMTSAGPIQVTASSGISIGGHGRAAGAQALIQIADAALYRAKASGRNRSELGRPSESSESVAASAQDSTANDLKPASR